MNRPMRAMVVGFGLAAFAVLASAEAATTLKIVKGSGEFRTLETAITVSDPVGVDLEWTTDAPGAAGGQWQVTGPTGAVVASGQAKPAPAAGHVADLFLPAATFLAAAVPPAPVTYSLTIRPFNTLTQPVGTVSAQVTVTQAKATPAPPVNFGPSANYPAIFLGHYHEQVGQVPNTQLQFAVGDVEIRARNTGTTKTDPVIVSVTDANGLMRTNAVVKFDGLQPNAAAVAKTVHLTAVLPPAQSQLSEEQQLKAWQTQYRAMEGVDFHALLDWGGPASSTPVDEHRDLNLYAGLGDSTPCQDGRRAVVTPADTSNCDMTGLCVHPGALARYIHRRLDCRVVGYAFLAGNGAGMQPFSEGQGRTAADKPSTAFKLWTKINVASVSKLITALATINLIDKKQASDPAWAAGLNTPIGAFLPNSWQAEIGDSPMKKITFRELLEQRSGIKSYGNNMHDVDSLHAFFTQPISIAASVAINADCAGPDVVPKMPFAPNDKSPCYSNINTAILRLVLPKADGATTDDPDQLAKAYVRIVEKRVFEPVGATAVECKPPPSGHAALGYQFPGINPGKDWGDQTESCGAEGWNLSVEDMGKVLNSLNAGVGKPLTPQQFTDMEKTHMGWDMVATSDGYFVRGAAPPSGFRYLEKDGGLTSGQNTLSTSALIYGGSAGTATSPPVRGFVAVLFMNSDVTREPNIGAADVLFQAFAKNAMKK